MGDLIDIYNLLIKFDGIEIGVLLDTDDNTINNKFEFGTQKKN